jgi:AraC-like DNA-binding protein
MTTEQKSVYEHALAAADQQHAVYEHRYIQLRQARQWIEQNSALAITVQEVAHVAAMSPFHFIRLFTQVYGLTPRQYLRDLRLQNARKLLQEGHSVTQVCFAVGYESLPTFSRVFKAGTGLSPKVYQGLNLRNRG